MKPNSSKQASEEKNRNVMTGTCAPSTPSGEIQDESTGIDTASARIANARRSTSKRRKTKSSDSDINTVGPSRKRRHGEDEKSTVTNLVEASASQTVAVSEDNKCSFCFSVTNRQGSSEDFLVCKDCNAKIHPSCMDLTEELARRASRSPWQCIECKTCNICNDAGDPEEMLFCDACDKGYHMNCHSPPVPEKPTGKWVCCRCTAELEASDAVEAPASVPAGLAVNTENGISGNSDAAGITGLPTPRDSPVHFTSAETISKEVMSAKIEDTAVILPKLSVTLVGEPPDASGWSVTEVVNFFTDIGFVEQAKIFQQEEIDGKALLLMTRNDVLTGMSFRLGPALKIYAHVKRLQSRDFAFLNYN